MSAYSSVFQWEYSSGSESEYLSVSASSWVSESASTLELKWAYKWAYMLA